MTTTKTHPLTGKLTYRLHQLRRCYNETAPQSSEILKPEASTANTTLDEMQHGQSLPLVTMNPTKKHGLQMEDANTPRITWKKIQIPMLILLRHHLPKN